MEGARARNGAPLPGRLPSFRLPHRSASSALCPCGHAASFRRRASSFVRGAWSSAALLPAAVPCERARCARRAGRRACARCCSVAAAAAAVVACCALRLSRRRARVSWKARTWWLHGARAGCQGGVTLASCSGCGRWVASLFRRRACGPLFLCSRCRWCRRRPSAPWSRPCPRGAWRVFMALLAARVARQRAARRWRCWRGAGGRCRSWP